MTLKEKFKILCKDLKSVGILDGRAVYINDDVLNNASAKECEQIADNYAIEFADWLIKRQTNYFESLKELLEIFKKEKGL